MTELWVHLGESRQNDSSSALAAEMGLAKFTELCFVVRHCNHPRRVNCSPMKTSLEKKPKQKWFKREDRGIWFAWLKCMGLNCKKRQSAHPALRISGQYPASSGKMHCRAACGVKKHILCCFPCRTGLGKTMQGTAEAQLASVHSGVPSLLNK